MKANWIITLLTIVSVHIQAQSLKELNVPQVQYPVESWKAFWITHPDIKPHDYNVVLFRRNFELTIKPETFIIHITADNRYWLYVNGQQVCFGPARSDLHHWRYETVDIAPFLKTGPNVIAVRVNNWGEAKAEAQFSAQTGLLLQGHGESEAIVNSNDKQWKTTINEGVQPRPVNWMYQVDIPFGYYAGSPTDSVNAAKVPWGWKQIAYNDSAWKTARWLASAGNREFQYAGKWLLTPRTVELLTFKPEPLGRIAQSTGIQPEGNPFAENKKILIPANRKVTLLIDQGYLTIGYPEMVVSGGKDAKIKATYAEALYDNRKQKGNRNLLTNKKIIGYKDVFMPDGGNDRVFQPLWLRPFRFIQLEIETKTQPLTIVSYQNWYTAYPLEANARFECDKPEYTKVWDIGWRTIQLCSQENFMSDAYYEQMQYIGDARVHALVALTLSGNDLPVREVIRQFDYSRIPDGLTLACYPNDWHLVIPTYSLVWIHMLHDYMMLRGDKEFLKQFSGGIRSVLGWYDNHVSENGMLGPLPWWNFVDWYKDRPSGVPEGAVEGGSAVISLQYALALQHASELLAFTGNKIESEQYASQAEEIRTSVYNLCYDETRGLLAETPDKKSFSQHTNILGVLTNSLAQVQYSPVMEKVLKDRTLAQTTFYFKFYLFEALKKTSMEDRYESQLEPWLSMLSLGLTTTPEEPGNPRSDCHPWSTSPNYEFLTLICGIRPASAGFEKVLIKPAPGTLRFIKATYPHPKGDIMVDLTRKGELGIEGNIIIPQGLSGTFVWNDKTIELNPGKQKISAK